MDCHWLKVSPSFKKGISIINSFDESKTEHFLKRIVTKLQIQDTNIFTEEEKLKLQKIFQVDEESLLLTIKSVLYVFKRLLKYVFMPNNVKKDLITLGFTHEKADAIVKVWSQETKSVLNELSTEATINTRLDVSWKLNAELSSNFCKKAKTPKAYLNLSSSHSQTEVELTHSELYSMFLQLESIQHELDHLVPS